MNDRRDFERIAARWLDDGSDTTPPEVIDAVLLAVRSTPQERDFRTLWRTPSMALYLRVAAIIAIVAVAGVAALYAFGAGPNIGAGPTPDATAQPTPTPAPAARRPLRGRDPVSAQRMTVVRQHVDAINARDADAFTDAFLPEGVFTPGGDFEGGSSLFGNSLPLADDSLVEAWMAINDAWGFEAEIIACNQDPGARVAYGYGAGAGDPMVVNCEVATRWPSLSLEITELWSYEFHGPAVGHWAFELLDLNPSERELPLGYDGLEAWEAWLQESDPVSAGRYLRPRGTSCTDTSRDAINGCWEWQESLAPGDPERAAELARLLSITDTAWSINGHVFHPAGLIPYDPALADEIDASIQKYLGELQS